MERHPTRSHPVRRAAAALVLALAFALAGCGEPGGGAGGAPAADVTAAPAAATTSALALEAAATGDAATATVALRYTRGAEQPGPRVAEVRVAYDPAALAYVAAAPGPAALAAGKQVVVQPAAENDADGAAALRVVLYAATNTERVDSGVLATLTFERLAAGPTTLSLQDRRPLLAPPEADDGLTLGAPLVLGGAGGAGGPGDSTEGGR